jgi:hypothetical protein
MDSRQFKEYKAILEEAIRQAGLTENCTIHETYNNAIFITTNRARECIVIPDGSEIHVLRRVRFQAPSEPTGYSFETKDIVDLAHPEGIVKLGIALKDLLSFSYLSKPDDLG